MIIQNIGTPGKNIISATVAAAINFGTVIEIPYVRVFR
jgi:hypothetical protein